MPFQVSFVGEWNIKIHSGESLKLKDRVKRKFELTYSNQLACEYQREDKSTDRSSRGAHFPPTQHRLQMLGERKTRGPLLLLAAGAIWCPHLFQTFLLCEETRLLLCVGTSSTGKTDPFSRLFFLLFICVFVSDLKYRLVESPNSSTEHSETWDLLWTKRTPAKSSREREVERALPKK